MTDATDYTAFTINDDSGADGCMDLSDIKVLSVACKGGVRLVTLETRRPEGLHGETVSLLARFDDGEVRDIPWLIYKNLHALIGPAADEFLDEMLTHDMVRIRYQGEVLRFPIAEVDPHVEQVGAHRKAEASAQPE